jgi:UDP-GlcNAc:undecaprenyl-phosphate GlcNAc-1-phosphate transferase
MFLGFMLATLAIISGGKIATVLAVFGIYAVDAVYVVARRVIHGKNPLSGDFTHLHHRLQDIGFSKNQILTLVFSLSFFF